MTTKKFKAKIESSHGGSGGAWVKVPFDVEKVFGKMRVPILATIDGEPYRGTLMRMGTPYHVLGVLKGIRAKIGKDVGDPVSVTVTEDKSERIVAVPKDLAAAFRNNAAARTFFEKLSYTHKKEYVQWIEEAKKPETRSTRIEKTIALLTAGKKTK